MIRPLALALAMLATPAVALRSDSGTGGVIRVLDKINGEVADVELRTGETRQVGRLLISLGDCRYPVENPSGDAFEWLTIRYQGQEEAVFQGWMIASSPALNAMDHPRYDVWALRCMTS